jgi:hypothetical protein
LRRGPSAARLIGSKSVKMASTTKIIDLSKQEACNGKDSVDPVPWIGSARKGAG